MAVVMVLVCIGAFAANSFAERDAEDKATLLSALEASDSP